MNVTNANQSLGFDKFSSCNYNLHWSFSNFNRILMVAGRIAQLPSGASVLELGAGTSDLENIVHNNFMRHDITFVKIDGDEKYLDRDDMIVCDITSSYCDGLCLKAGKFDAVVLMEVIEHLVKDDAYELIERIFTWLKPEAMFYLTTPTPPYYAKFEDRVWPLDHEREFTLGEITSLVNKYFKVQKTIGWSLEERDYNHLLESDQTLAMVYTKLREAYPESYIRALISSLAPIETNRQILLICKKRRVVAC